MSDARPVGPEGPAVTGHQLRRLGEASAVLPDAVARVAQPGKVLVVTGEASFPSTDGAALVKAIGGSRVIAGGDLPRYGEYRRLRAVAGPGPYGCIVAVGGGRVIDLAKLLSIELEDPADLSRAVDVRSPLGRRSPLVAVPTTAGSGSESTPFAVLYLGGRKHSVDHPSLLPDVAVLDWRLLRSCPRSVLAASGLDALCQAIEALLSRRFTAPSNDLALRALRLGVPSLPSAIDRSPPALRRMAAAANLAGRAIAITRTTIPHALSYPLTERCGLPHGHAVALSMGRYLRRFGQALSEEPALAPWAAPYSQVLRALRCVGSEEVPDRWAALIASVGLPTTLAGCGVGIDVVPELVAGVDPLRFSNAPWSFGSEELADLFA